MVKIKRKVDCIPRFVAAVLVCLATRTAWARWPEGVLNYCGFEGFWDEAGWRDVGWAQRIGYAAAKAEDSGCAVVGGSISELQVRREGWKESLALGLAKYCDIYDFHFYSDLATTQDLLDYIHRTCREFRAEKPIWVTETTQVGMFEPDDRNQVRDSSAAGKWARMSASWSSPRDPGPCSFSGPRGATPPCASAIRRAGSRSRTSAASGSSALPSKARLK
jgi:hypothetical protein